MKNVNVINNTGNQVNVTVNEEDCQIEIIIDMSKNEFKLPRNLKPGDVFKDLDGDEYIFLYCEENGDAAILRKESLRKMKFGRNNNYNDSDIDKYLSDIYIIELERKFGVGNIVEHEVDLLSLDGENDYGVIKREVSIPTLDCYRHNKKAIKKHIKERFWLATPNSTPSSLGSGCIRCVYTDGGVGYFWYDSGNVAVLPFFVLKSTVFEVE